MACPHCGKEIPGDALFCPYCRHRVAPAPRTQSTTPLAILAFVLSVAVIVLTVLYLRGNRNTPPATVVTPAPVVKPDTTIKPDAITKPPSPATARTLTSNEIAKQAAASLIFLTNVDVDGRPAGYGSGFVIAPDKIATNYHVIRAAASMTAKLPDGRTLDVGGILAYDKPRDFAILKIDGLSLPALPLADSGTTQTGDFAAAMGAPETLQASFSTGIISAIRQDLLQTTVPISPGSSGGPLLNDRGQVIGITSAQVRATGAENLNIAIPINWLKTSLSSDHLSSFATIRDSSRSAMPIHTSMTVGAKSRQRIPIPCTQQMANARLTGTISSTGGVGGKIHVGIVTGTRTVDLGNAAQLSVDQPLLGGPCFLVIQNDAMLLPRTVTLDLSLNYIR